MVQLYFGIYQLGDNSLMIPSCLGRRLRLTQGPAYSSISPDNRMGLVEVPAVPAAAAATETLHFWGEVFFSLNAVTMPCSLSTDND